MTELIGTLERKILHSSCNDDVSERITLRASDDRKIEIYKNFYRQLGLYLVLVLNETSTLHLKLFS